MKIFIRIVISALALWLATAIVPGLNVPKSPSTGENLIHIAIIGAIFAGVTHFIRPIVKFLSLPFYLVTLGLFFLVVNALMIMLTGWITAHTSWPLHVDGFGAAFLGGIVVSLATLVLEPLLVRDEY